MHQHRSAPCVIAQYLRTPISAGCFFGTPQTFFSLAATHSSGWRLVIMGITLAIPFSQAPCRVFFLHSNFYLRAHKGAFMALFCYLSFLHGLALPNLRALRVRTICTNRPLQLATLVCSSARCGYLTPYLSVPKRTDNF